MCLLMDPFPRLTGSLAALREVPSCAQALQRPPHAAGPTRHTMPHQGPMGAARIRLRVRTEENCLAGATRNLPPGQEKGAQKSKRSGKTERRSTPERLDAIAADFGL